jgi:hypothetical protein
VENAADIIYADGKVDEIETTAQELTSLAGRQDQVVTIGGNPLLLSIQLESPSVLLALVYPYDPVPAEHQQLFKPDPAADPEHLPAVLFVSSPSTRFREGSRFCQQD